MSASYTVLGEKDGFVAELITKDNGEGYVVVSVNDASMTLSVEDWRLLDRVMHDRTIGIKGLFRFVEV